MTHRMVRLLCSTIVLALVLVSLAIPMRQQTMTLAEECRSGYVITTGECGAPALASGTNTWWRDDGGTPVAAGYAIWISVPA